ncbi:MAG: bifunctional (p)ppGpp synthetase/guanosine-3',5'-bis(diphosphate) 3'-pyrophosphohydrolase [Oscillospiraceae bacterium]|nr:bifunctional (p)ppGpp synthetase/guanosine-3',5'-bis(diphosphate) 3'-pyrophosphohydrolase [Oscillospiraceae bacterium]
MEKQISIKPISADELYEKLESEILEANPSADAGRIRTAYEFAKLSHGDQRRRDGSEYVSHTVAAAQICVELGLDEEAIIAALLHDCLEDTSASFEEISKRFGASVAEMVEGVTKLSRVQYASKEDEQMENMRKMLLAMSRDIRVILIKIADRLHNMRTMEYQTPIKQRMKSLETMEIYAPIAHRLGMQKIKWELEDLSLYYLDPIGYKEITDTLESRMGTLETFMAKVKDAVVDRLSEAKIHCQIEGRIKHIYSIYRKMYSQSKEIDEIFDLCAFRVIVDDLSECYNVLGHIHDMFKPIPNRFKDYISTPKPNMYQSIHTTVIGEAGIPFEVQIRTWDMHRTAEYGVAAHWKYKNGTGGVKTGDEEKFAWVRVLLESQQDSDAQDFIRDLKVDMFSDEVFVFTPQGDVINLPAGASPIDFAYGIHSAVGNSMVGAKVNGRMVSFSTQLQNGDIVEVITSKSAPGPNRDWLNIARSGAARAKIKQWFKRERREENIIHGKAAFENELKHSGVSATVLTDEELLANILKRLSVTSMDDIYAAIGYGGVTATRVVNRVKDELVKSQKPAQKTSLDRINEQAERRKNAPQSKNAVHGVLVEGVDGCLVKFAKCCTPVPGDDIVGFITRGFGVSVHRRDCKNYISSRNKADDSGRWIKVSWVESTHENYSTTIRLLTKERSGVVMDIATILNAMNARVLYLTAKDIEGGKTSAVVTLEVKALSDLEAIIARLATIRDVIEISRAGN